MQGAADPEKSWRRLVTNLELRGEFDLFLIECADARVRRTVRARLREWCRAAGMPFEEPRSDASGVLANPLEWLSGMRAAAARSAPPNPVLYYLPLDDERQSAFYANRLNEQRDNLRRELRGALCLAGEQGFLRWLPAQAPDLWSARTQSFVFPSLAEPPSEPTRSYVELETLRTATRSYALPKSAPSPSQPSPPPPSSLNLPAPSAAAPAIADDAFISYVTAEGRDLARRLHARLTSDGLRVHLKEETAGVTNRTDAIRALIERCRYFVPIVTGGYGYTGWSRTERGAGQELRRGMIIPVVAPGGSAASFPGARDSFPIAGDQDFDSVYPALCRALGGLPLSSIPRDRLPDPPSAAPAHVHLPPLPAGDHFVDGVDAIWHLHDELAQRKVAFLTGPAGSGKTRLAVEYGRRFAPWYGGGVYFVSAAGGRMEAFQRLAVMLGATVSTRHDEPSLVAMVWSLLVAEGRRALVICDEPFPNAPGPPEVAAWLPGSGEIMFLGTSRFPVPTQFGAALEPRLSADAALRLLTESRPPTTPEEVKAAITIVDKLDRSPLALRLTRSQFESGQGTWTSQLGALEHADGGAPNALGTSVRLLIDGVSPTARPVLRIFATLASAPVSWSLLRAIAGQLDKAQSSSVAQELEVAVAELLRSSLLFSESDGALRCHGVAWAALQNQEMDRAVLVACTSGVIAEVQVALGASDRSQLPSMAMHLSALAGRERTQASPLFVGIARLLSSVNVELGNDAAALAWSAEQLDASRTIAASGDSSLLLTALAGDARLKLRLGMAVDALAPATEAVQLWESTPESARSSSKDPRTLRAQVLQALGDHDAAVAVLEQVIASPGSASDAEVVEPLRALSHSMAAKGHLQDAVMLLERARQIVESSGGSDDPRLVTVLAELGALQGAQGNWQGARALHERAIAIATLGAGRGSVEAMHVRVGLAVAALQCGEAAAAEALISELEVELRGQPASDPHRRIVDELRGALTSRLAAAAPST